MTSLKFYWLIVSILVVWRVTHLFVFEDGPWDIVVRIRKAAGESFWGGLLDCFYCFSVWAAAPLALIVGETLLERLLLWPAISGAAILLERFTDRR